MVERLQRDPEAIGRLKDKLLANPTESETASLPRYLMLAGALDDDVHERAARCFTRKHVMRFPFMRSFNNATNDCTRQQ